MYIAAGVFSVSPVPDFHPIRKDCDTCKNYGVVSLGSTPSWRAFVYQVIFIAQNLAWLGLYQGAVELALFASDVLVIILVVIVFFS